jgi:apolipoprotein N-acyltransferase
MSTAAPTRRLFPPRTSARSLAMHLLYLAASAFLLAFAFPSPGWWPLAHVALVPAGILAVRTHRPWQLAWTSYIVFLLWLLVMLRWLIPVTVGGYVGLSALQALYFALAFLAINLINHRFRTPMVLLLPMVWVTIEYLRGHFPEGGFGWFFLSHSQAPYADGQAAGRFLQVADLFGDYAVSFLVAMTNGLIIDLFTLPWFKPGKHGFRRLRRTVRGIVVLWLLAMLSAWLYGQYRLSQFHDATEPGPRIAVVQTNVPQDNKNVRTLEQDVADFRSLVQLTQTAADDLPKPHLIIWPETMVPGPLNPEAIDYFETTDTGWAGMDIYHRQIQELVRLLDVNLFVGAHAYHDWVAMTLSDGRQGEVPSRRANSAYLYYADGMQAPQHYDKIHLVPFGEYIPWVSYSPLLKRLFVKYLSPYPFDYSLVAGDDATVFDIPVQTGEQNHLPARRVRFVTPICYEDAVPGVVRNMIYGRGYPKRADVLVNLTNSAWYSGNDQRPQHLQIAVYRSIENRVPTARSVNTGLSGFIDSVGRIGPLVHINDQDQLVAGIAKTEVRLDPRQSLYGLMGEGPVVCLALLTGALFVGVFVKRGK